MKKHVGFFFLNHSAHIYHCLSIALELSLISKNKVSIFSSTIRNHNIILEIAEKYFSNHQCEIILLKPSLSYTITRYLKNREFPGFNAIFKNNIELLKTLDILVSPSDDILGLKRKFNLESKIYVTALHGAGDLGYNFSESLASFDYIFLAGKRLKELLDEEKSKAQLSTVQPYIIGYPKAELCTKFKTTPFKSDITTIFYAPHFNSYYNSWPNLGQKLVTWISQNESYKLILAPHILMNKKQKKEIAKFCKAIPNIHVDIDSNSKSLIDMTYINQSDIFIGDKTSQVYEFMLQPRPCIFFNTTGTDWKTSKDANFEAWHLGQVVDDQHQIDKAIKNAEVIQEKFVDLQRTAISERISQFEEGSALRAARFIDSL